MFCKYTKLREIGKVAAVVTAVAVISACGSDDDDSTASTDPTETTDPADPTDTGGETTTVGVTISPDMFVEGGIASSEIVDCTLSDGTESQCYEIITTAVQKSGDLMGPYCPTSGTSTAEEAGTWLDGTSLYQADGDFFYDLPNIYGDTYPPIENWNFFESDGTLRVASTLQACIDAAQPTVAEENQRQCVECPFADIETADVVTSFTIPVTPTPADAVGTLSGAAGISLSGFQLAAVAPVELILGNWTVAPFDDCGGHVNHLDGYHFHAATGAEGCNSNGADTDGHPVLIGFAMDGYGIYGTLEDTDAEANSLDECNGVEDDAFGYHYHAMSPELNGHIGCYHGNTVPGGGGGGPGGGGPPG